MEIIVDSQGDRVSEPEMAQKISQALDILGTGAGKEKLAWFKTLAAILRDSTPRSYLVAPTVEQLADWLDRFFRFISGRREETAVDIIPMGREGHSLLLTNCPDVPYLFDSLQTYLSGRQIRFQVISHPILRVQRKKGALEGLAGLDGEGKRESFILMELEGIGGEQTPGIREDIRRIFREAIAVQRDAKAMEKQFRAMGKLPAMTGHQDFMRWLEEGNFLVFSYRRLQVEKGEGEDLLVREEEGSRLGIFPDPQEPALHPKRPLQGLDKDFRGRMEREGAVLVEEVPRLSPIYRAERLVYLGFRETLGSGNWAEHAFLGLFPPKSADEVTSSIPALRRKIEKALEFLGIPKNCHDYRKTIEIFNTFPKAELFFMDQEELVRTVRSFTLLYRQGAVKVVVSANSAVRGVTLLVIMPRQFYSPEFTGRMEAFISRYFQSPRANSRIIHIAADYLSLHVSVQPEKKSLRIDLDRLERGLGNIARPWRFRLRMLLDQQYGDLEGGRLWQQYLAGFSREYRTLVHPRFALRDIRGIEKVRMTEEDVFDLWGPFREEEEEFYRLQYYSPRKSYLNALMPLLENLNLRVIDEVDFSVEIERRVFFIKSFSIRGGISVSSKLSALRETLLEALRAMHRKEAENDYLNRLLVLTGLGWKEIDVFRGYRNYYFQLGSPYTKRRVAFALINNPHVALQLFRYFEARFKVVPEWTDPVRREEEALFPIRLELASALEQVTDINEDDILRTLFNLIDSTVRTNFFVRRNQEDYFFSFKISAIGIIDMPAPRPMYEIYVHSATMEGIHLRGGKVARGGLRWSDRPDDFRTEILGLMKTQMTKNAVIVPVGSKGGFVVKTPFATREEGAALSKAAYQTLIRGLLDLTDNRVGDRVVRPAGILSYDEEDPYLVVAADKGTAHLPDTANAISLEYGFWLGDAFASGGSHGYDHKKLGITARGAWECVKRHFRELGIDIQTEPFTVVGIGDMSGDVFGNGMLLSKKIRLLAAFDHRHIFLDPDPDPESSFRERQRLFDLPRSSWQDFDKELISTGGGVYPRSAKDIPLSPQVRRWLGVRHESMDGPGLIRLLLAAEVDLLWNGGIGTYVKANSEKNEDVGDRANDSVRVDAGQLRAKVVGEGGNLGFTQKGRIEFALGGGRINTDAVDNSAGVDCSDHEVNLKIFMRHLQERGVIPDQQERDRQLEEITGDVCLSVLANNYGQSLSLSLDQIRCAENVEPYLDLANRLENTGMLDPRGEFLPSAREIRARKNQGYTRPELAILLAYSKMQLFQALLKSDIPDREAFRSCFFRYFPPPLIDRFGEQLPGHPLVREITATVITNMVIDQGGSTFIDHLARETGTSPADAVSAYLTFDQVLGGENLRRSIFSLDGRMSADRQYQLLRRLEEMLAKLCLWTLRQGMKVSPEASLVADFRAEAHSFSKALGGILADGEWQQCKGETAELEQAGLGNEAARQLAILPCMEDFMPTVSLREKSGGDLPSVAKIFSDVKKTLEITDMLQRAGGVPIRDRWDRLAHQTVKTGFQAAAYNLTLAVLRDFQGNPEAFFGRHRLQMKGYHRLVEQLRSETPGNYNPFTVLISTLDGMLA